MENIITKFCNNKMPREGFQFVDLSVILILKYYPEVFLEECKNVVKEKKNPKNIVDDIEFVSDSHEKILMKKVLMKKILMKKILMKKILMKKILMR